MDEAAAMNPELLPKLFEMGIIGIETPEEFGGAGASFTMACIAVEELGRVDGSVSVLVDVQNTLCDQCLLKMGHTGAKQKYLPQLASQKVGAYALSESSRDQMPLRLSYELRIRVIDLY